MIAEANALEGDGDLVAGATLTVPEVKTSSNDASTFKPYDPGDIVGPTSPGLPYIQSADAGCNTFAAIIRIVVTAVLMVTPLAPVAAAAFAGIGELAAQSVEISGGQRQGYDWGNIVVSAASASIGAKAGAGFIEKAQSTAGAYARTAVVAAGKTAVNYTASYAINKALGEGVHFSWRELAIGSVTSAITSTFLGGSSPRTGANGIANNIATSAAFSWKDLAVEAVRSVMRQGVEHVVRDAIQGDAHWSWRRVLQTAAQDMAVVGLAGLMIDSGNRRALKASAGAASDRAGDELIELAFGPGSGSHENEKEPIDWSGAYVVASNGPDFSSLEQWAGPHARTEIARMEAERSKANDGNHVVKNLDDARALLVRYLGTDDPAMIESMSRNPISLDGPSMSGHMSYQFGEANRFNLNEPYFGNTIATIYVTRDFVDALKDKFEGRGTSSILQPGSFDQVRERHRDLASGYSDPGVDHMPMHARIGHSKAMGSAAAVEGLLSGITSWKEMQRRMNDFMIVGVYQSFTGKKTFLVTTFQQAVDRRSGNVVRWIPVMTPKNSADYQYLIQGRR